MGVQMPGPDNSGADEQGFDAVGLDMSSLAPMGVFPVGVQMPGDPARESGEGWDFGANMAGMAAEDPSPVGMDMGVFSDDADFVGDVSVNAQPAIINSFDAMFGHQPGEESSHAFLPGMAMRDLPVGVIPNQGYPNAGPGQGGIDSMAGLDLAGGPAPLGEQDTHSTGPVGIPTSNDERNAMREPTDHRDGTGY